MTFRQTLYLQLGRSSWSLYKLLDGLPGFARDFNCQLCIYVSLFLYLSISLYLCLATLSLPNLTKPQKCLPADLPTPPLSLTPPSLFPDQKFPVQAHFWLDQLFYYKEIGFHLHRFVFPFHKNFYVQRYLNLL